MNDLKLFLLLTTLTGEGDHRDTGLVGLVLLVTRSASRNKCDLMNPAHLADSLGPLSIHWGDLAGVTGLDLVIPSFGRSR